MQTMKVVKATTCFAVMSVVVSTLIPSARAATKTVNFNNYPLNFSYVDWLSHDVHTSTSGFSYMAPYTGTGTPANGQRWNKNGVTWPDAAYYDSVLGAGVFSTYINIWNMKALIVYGVQKNGDWYHQGWYPFQAMTEGAACVDDAARTAIAYEENYLLNSDASSFQKARDFLTFTGYLTTKEGKVYNFAWLDAPAIFGWDQRQQANDAHFMFPMETVTRSGYPSANGGQPDSAGNWGNPFYDPDHQILYGPGPSAGPAIPFMPHPKYSIYMNDLVDAAGNSVATRYYGPTYTSPTGTITGHTSYLITNNSTSSQAASTGTYSLSAARNLWAFCKALQMMKKYESLNGALSGDQLVFAEFAENHINRMMGNLHNFQASLPNHSFVGNIDTKLASNILIGLSDYYQTVYGSTPYGRYTLRLTTAPAAPMSQGDVYALMNDCINTIAAKQYKSSDWRDGIFISDISNSPQLPDGSYAPRWQAWGELEIYALARAYNTKYSCGESAAQLAPLLAVIEYSADRFYGQQAYHYSDYGTAPYSASKNYSATKNRIPSIQIINGAWYARFQTNDLQIVYANSSIVAGLRELSSACFSAGDASKGTQYLYYMRNVATWLIGNNSTVSDIYDPIPDQDPTDYKGHGTFFDGIGINSQGAPYPIRDAGGESQAEGIWAITIAKKAIAQNPSLNLTPFAFDY